MRVLGVITARGGSKGVPRKNIRPLAGIPLIAHTIRAANEAKLLTDVVVSTEDQEIAAVAREYGGNVPFMRPEELAGDSVLSLPVVQHATREMEQRLGCQFDAIMLLQPTSPLRTAAVIDECLTLLAEAGCDSVVSAVESPVHPFKMKRIVDGNLLINYVDQGFDDMRPRQMLPKVYKRSGDVYVTKRDLVMEHDILIAEDCRAVVVDKKYAVDIDSEIDFMVAEALMSGK